VIAIYIALQYGTYYVATTNRSALPGLVVAIEAGSVLSILGVIVLLIWRLPARIEERLD
jgi:hypothetical protein